MYNWHEDGQKKLDIRLIIVFTSQLHCFRYRVDRNKMLNVVIVVVVRRCRRRHHHQHCCRHFTFHQFRRYSSMKLEIHTDRTVFN